MKFILLIATALGGFATPLASAADYHVTPAGSDSNDELKPQSAPSPQIADPLLERGDDGDRRLFLSAKSPVRTDGIGNFADATETPKSSLKN